MVASSDDIALMSPYAVGQGKFTQAVFDYLSNKAQLRLDRERPSGMSQGDYDHAHALLICHLYKTTKLDGGGLKSESIGAYSYSQDPGESSYLIEYRQLLASIADAYGSDMTGDHVRADADMDEMHLDQSDIPKYLEE